MQPENNAQQVASSRRVDYSQGVSAESGDRYTDMLIQQQSSWAGNRRREVTAEQCCKRIIGEVVQSRRRPLLDVKLGRRHKGIWDLFIIPSYLNWVLYCEESRIINITEAHGSTLHYSPSSLPLTSHSPGTEYLLEIATICHSQRNYGIMAADND